MFSTCDKIDNPIKENAPFIWNKRKIIIYDFTGHQCIHCTKAHEMISQLKKQYKESAGDSAIIPIAIHCGSFANIRTGGEKFRYDFRTDVGDFLGGRGENLGYYGELAMPIGLVNNLSKNNLSTITAWPGETQKYISSIPYFFINISPNFSVDSIISCDVKIITNIENSRKLNLIVFLLEDNIIQNQQTEEFIAEYQHNNVLRAGFNGAFGEVIKSNSDRLIYLSEINKSVSLSAKDHDWKIDDCSIVAFVYDSDTQEILQAENCKVR
jgi:hypothetical protein